LEQLAEENRQLHDQLDRLRAAAGQNSRGDRTGVQPIPGDSRPPSNPGNTAANSSSPARLQPPERAVASRRTHRVQAGETPMAIARRYNVKLDALLSANPGLNPKRLQIGQSLVIPNR